MQHVQLSDQLYQEAQRRAADAGFVNVDEYVADVLRSELQDNTENLDRFFTLDRLAQIDRATAQIKAGESYTAEQVREHFKHQREA